MSEIQVRVNALCVAGVAVGVASLLFPWITGGNVPGHADYRDLLLKDIILGSHSFSALFLLFCSMFVVGTGLSILTPAGGFIQLIGLLGFLYSYPSAYRDMPGSQQLALGAFIGMLSTVMTIVGFSLPVGPGFRSRWGLLHRMVSTANRFLTFSPFDSAAKLRVNLLCVVGAFVAFVSVALPWLTTSLTGGAGHAAVPGTESSLYAYMTESSSWMIGAWIFVLASAAAFMTPLAGFGQLIGLLWWWGSARNAVGTNVLGDQTLATALGNGFYLGIFAIAVVLASFIFPIGFGYLGRKGSMKARLFAWGQPALSRIG